MKNEQIFIDVINSNLEALKNRINNQTFDFTILKKTKLAEMSGEEVRNLAVAFFTKELACRLSELNDSRIFIDLNK